MAGENTVVNLGENSPEQVAFKLLQLVAAAEGKVLSNTVQGRPNSDREYILETYSKCLDVVKGCRP